MSVSAASSRWFLSVSLFLTAALAVTGCGDDDGGRAGTSGASAAGQGGFGGTSGIGGIGGSAGVGGDAGAAGLGGGGGIGGSHVDAGDVDAGDIDGGGGTSGDAGTGGTPANVCGNGIREDGEECDDLNRNGNDGCDGNCLVEAGWVCIGAIGNLSACAFTCGNGVIDSGEQCDLGPGVTHAGCVNCQVASGYACDGGEPTTCDEVCGDGQVVGNEACDDSNTANGDYCNSTCTMVTGYCGDGVRQTNEDCDDGNNVDDDYCDNQCQDAGGCGDSVLQSNEDCDPSLHSTDCTACVATIGFVCSRQPPYVCQLTCGDGLRAPEEACDDSNNDNGDGCSAGCQLEAGFSCVEDNAGLSTCTPICGDGNRVGTEACDDGNTANGDYCNSTCTMVTGSCGDGVRQTNEACDDGNTANGDYCNSTCTMVTGSCGDGIQQANEACDDNNTASGDYCNSTCTTVTGYCGDGIRQTNETCDDSNLVSNDGCSATCTQEPGYRCTGAGPGSCRRLYCYLDFDLSGQFEVTNTTLGAGDGSYPQTGGRVRVRVPDVNGAPGNGPVGTLYYRMPTVFTRNVSIPLTGNVSVMTNTLTTAGTPSNECPLNSGGILSGNVSTAGMCPYFPRRTGADPLDLDGDGNTGSDTLGHCTTEWNARMQNPPQITPGPGCLHVNNTGTITCSDNNSILNCGSVGLTKGTVSVDDAWYQPQNSLTYSNNFTTVTMGAVGRPTDCDSLTTGQPSARLTSLEVPGRNGSRTWVRWTGTRTAISCGHEEPDTCN